MRAVFIPLFALGATALVQHRHAHGHMHVHEKKDVIEEKVSVTVVECVLGDRSISEAECNEGIMNGTLRWADDGSLLAATTSHTTFIHSATSSPVSVAKPAVASPPPPPAKVYSSAPAPPAPAPPAQSAPSAPSPVAAKAQPSTASHYTSSGSAAGVNLDFPDGQLDCSTFPSEYGAVPVDWLNLGGWASVQKPNIMGASGYNDIMSVTKSQCTGSGCCLEGSFCSYACPEGYMKFQWPSLQGATGQSIGGLSCQNGKLHLTNPSVKTLCAPGTNNIKVYVQNKLSQNVAVCRTNYPGDEKMSIPVDAQPGSKKQLACPDSSTFYQWQGKGTSAQHYVNLPGISVDRACVWGNPGDDFGNWAPLIFGSGWSNNRGWFAVTANHPTQMSVTAPYTVEIVGGDTKCRYQNGQYCGGPNYESCNTEGCTVSSAGNDVTFLIY